MSTLPSLPGYDLQRQLGVGGMGIVFMATRPDNDYKYAIKMLLVGRNASVEELLRFRIEAEAYACLNHPNIIKIRDVGVVSGCPYLAMDYAENGSLNDYIQKTPQLSLNWRISTIKKVAEALAHAHGRRILHRDLKPSNILITAEGLPKVSDFGLVKFSAPMADVNQACCTMNVNALDEHLLRLANENKRLLPARDNANLMETLLHQCSERSGLATSAFDLDTIESFVRKTVDSQTSAQELLPLLDDMTRCGSVMGSPQFMSPEQAQGRIEDIGPQTDVYGLGATLYFLLTGQAPVVGKNAFEVIRNVSVTAITPPERLNADISSDLSAVVQKALEKKPKNRYASMEHFAHDLDRILDGGAPTKLNAQSHRDTSKRSSIFQGILGSLTKMLNHVNKASTPKDKAEGLQPTELYDANRPGH